MTGLTRQAQPTLDCVNARQPRATAGRTGSPQAIATDDLVGRRPKCLEDCGQFSRLIFEDRKNSPAVAAMRPPGSSS